MKKLYTSFLLFLFLNVSSSSAQYGWTQKANYGGGEVYDAFTFEIGTKAYSGSGISFSHVYRTDFWVWDQTTNVWTQKADFAGAGRYGARGFSIDSVGYVTSGCAGNGYPTDLWAYDTLTNSWSQKQSFPGTGRYTGVSFALKGKGYFGGGYDGNYFNDLWQYDPSTDSWSQQANFPGTARQGTSRFVVNNIAYVGLGSNADININLSDFYKYNPDSNTWRQVADFPGAPRNGAYSFAINNNGYIVCGYNYTISFPASIFSDFWTYSVDSDSWSQLPDFPGKPVFEGIYYEIGADGYIGSGCDSANNSFSHYSPTFWQYGLLASPHAAFQSNERIICANSCVNFTNESTNSTSWQWFFPGAVPDTSTAQNPQHICYFDSAASYNVTLIASDSLQSDTLSYTNYITAYPLPQVSHVSQRGDTLFCTPSDDYTSYQWFFGDSTLAGANDTFLIATQAGFYSVEVRDENGCSVVTTYNYIPLGLNNFKANDYFALYPNPVDNELIVYIVKAVHSGNIEVCDVLGRKLYQQGVDAYGSEHFTINFSNFSSGIYFVSLTSGEEKATYKVMKE